MIILTPVFVDPIFQLNTYPDINISRELCHHSANSTYHDDRKAVMMPINEPLIKRVARTYIEDGLIEALHEASDQEAPSVNPVVCALAKYALHLIDLATRIRYYIRPHGRNQGIFSIANFSHTR